MKLLQGNRFLTIYSGVLTIVFAGTILGGATLSRSNTFGTITVRRINVVEPDGTVRLTISNRADFPGAWNRNKEYPRPDRTEAAGMLFMNEEGTEQGGLIWGAHEDANGRVDGRVHLSVDQYEENQIFAIDAGQDGNEKFSQLAIIDQGDYPISEKRATNDKIARLPPAQRDAAWRQFFATHRHDVRRLMLGRSPDGSVGLELRDSRGKVRAVFAVEPNGNPVLRLLDENGKVVKAVTIN